MTNGFKLLLDELKKINSFVTIFLILIALAIPLFGVFSLYDPNIQIEINDYILSITYFTIFQSLLSALFALIVGSIFAYFLKENNELSLVRLIINLLSILFVLPTIIIVLGMLNIFNSFTNIYGPVGIIICHVILNIPLVARIIYQSIEDISGNEYLLAKQMGLKRFGTFLATEWPVIKKNLPSLFVLIFFICFVSFTPVLLLGGSPKFSTIEVSIYQSVVFLNDYNVAFNLLMLQILICSIVFFLTFRSFKSNSFIIDERKTSSKYEKKIGIRFIDYLIIVLISLLLFISPITIFIKGINIKFIEVINSDYFLTSLIDTLFICIGSGILSLIFTINILRILEKSKRTYEYFFYIFLVLSPGIISIGYYVVINNYLQISIPSIMIVIIINSLFALPFTYNYLSASYFRVSKEHHDIASSMNIYGVTRIILFDWPRLKTPITNAFCISSILSASDLVIISFFGTNDLSTLTQTIYRLMGSYRMDEAYSLTMILFIFCFIYFSFFRIILVRKDGLFN